ncbi:MAG: hypothetical protein HYR85_13880 [Planctomycetes bacterium]|nr:hypothetical protein [Planctomycetota bacterium]MBI3843574.1 hypothetical protein [Planctomycetota bacterium]
MLSDEKIEAYRRMTPARRWKETEELMTWAWRALLALPLAERNRRLQVVRDEHDRSDANMLAHMRKLERMRKRKRR